jgi:L-asparaginase
VFCEGSYLLTLDDMTAICAKIREALIDPLVVGVVVMHGTDTMEETAYLAELTRDDPRPVVFTGAQNSADSSEPDGPDNLADAIAVASSPEAAGRGVLLCFAGQIFPARGVRKTHTFAFTSARRSERCARQAV